MKDLKKSKTIEFLGDFYRITRYIGADVIEIEKLVEDGFVFKHDVWLRIYFGSITLLEDAIAFFKEK